MSYIDVARERLAHELPGLDKPLMDLYTLLVLVKGQDVTLRDVHDAWAVWRSRTDPEHRSLVPFKELSEEVQELDRKYADAIARVAASLRI